jgi:hypothetical protein
MFPNTWVDFDQLVANEPGWYIKDGSSPNHRWVLFNPSVAFVYIKYDGSCNMCSTLKNIEMVLQLFETYAGDPIEDLPAEHKLFTISSVQFHVALDKPFDPMMIRQPCFSRITPAQLHYQPWKVISNGFKYNAVTNKQTVSVAFNYTRFANINETWQTLIHEAKNTLAFGLGLNMLNALEDD